MKETFNQLSIGDRIGYLVIMEPPFRRGSTEFVTIQCDCGTVRDVETRRLKIGNLKTKSCGCYSKSSHDRWSHSVFRSGRP